MTKMYRCSFQLHSCLMINMVHCLLLCLFIITIQRVQGRCSGGIWPIESTSFGSWNITWKYNAISYTVQFFIQGQWESSINRTSTYISLAWSDDFVERNQTDLMMFFPEEEILQDRYADEHGLPLIDRQNDLCLLESNRSDQSISIAFERLISNDDLEDISFTSNLYLSFSLGTYTFFNDTIHIDSSNVLLYHQSLNTTRINLISCYSNDNEDDDCILTNCSRTSSCSCLQVIPTNTSQCFCFPSFSSCRSKALPSMPTNVSISAIMNGSCDTTFNPCSSNGICLQTSMNQYLCQCQPDYTGVLCQIPLFLSNLPSMNICQCVNGGVCLLNGSCACPDRYRGKFCHIDNPCHDFCPEHAICSTNCSDTSCEDAICQCPMGTTGIDCGIKLDLSCADNPCSNDRICQMNNQTGLYSCQCPTDAIDHNGQCQTIESICATKTCSDHGICMVDVSGENPRAICLCSPGYTGLTCEDQTLNPCASEPCGTNGTCIRTLHGSYQCTCEDGSIGLSCSSNILTTTPLDEITYSPCLNNPCHYLSTCQQIQTKNGTEIKCLCPNYLTGDRCQYPNQCQKQPCLNQGTCHPLDSLNSFMCQCPPGYGHYDCSIYLGLSCDTNVCLNGGRCEQNSTMIQCLCSNGFAGSRCEWNSVCSNNTCENGGTCRQIGSTSAECLCPAGFAGPTCHLRDSCATFPCQNGGGCTTLLADTGTEWSAYRCVCPPGIYGQNCDTRISSCANMNCPVYQICSEQPTGPVCTCPNNKVGNFCQYEHPCRSIFDCRNGGTCIASKSDPPSRQCLCPEGYTGDQCETIQNRNPCANNPCQTRGQCILSKSNRSYTCRCHEQFVGEHCERKNPCVSSPCLNQGVCQARYNESQTWFKCRCVATYTGDRCETSMLNPCGGLCMNGSPCNNGVCICPAQYTGTFCGFENPCFHPRCQNGGLCSVIYNTTDVSYTCTCPSAYTGEHCESMIDRQSTNVSCTSTCLNGGSCVNDVCVCSSSFIGPLCQYENPCVNKNACLNGGTCFGRYHSNGTLSTQCFCPQGYTGRLCESILCSSTSCNGGVCTATENNIVCQCPTGKFGDRCQFADICAMKPCLTDERCEQIGHQYQCISCYDRSSYCSIYQLRNEYCDNRYTVLVDNQFLSVPQACRRSCGQCIPVQRLKDIDGFSSNVTLIQTLTMTTSSATNKSHCVDQRDDCSMQKAYGFCRIFNEKYPDDCRKTCHPDCSDS